MSKEFKLNARIAKVHVETYSVSVSYGELALLVSAKIAEEENLDLQHPDMSIDYAVNSSGIDVTIKIDHGQMPQLAPLPDLA